MLKIPSNGRNSAGLNSTELQRGHIRRIHSTRGSQFGQLIVCVFIRNQTSFPGNDGRHYCSVPPLDPECASSHESKQRMLPVARATQESEAP